MITRLIIQESAQTPTSHSMRKTSLHFLIEKEAMSTIRLLTVGNFKTKIERVKKRDITADKNVEDEKKNGKRR